MGSLLAWVAIIGGLVVGWIERLFYFEWLVWLLGGGFRLIWWLARFAGQAALAMLMLVGLGDHQFQWPRWGSSEPTLSLTAELADQFREVVKRSKWSEGDTVPLVWTVNGGKYWVLIRGDLDTTSHTDERNQPAPRECLHLYAALAVPDGGKYLTPHPYNPVGMLTWPEVVIECRMAGNSSFEFPALGGRTAANDDTAPAYKPGDRREMDRLIANNRG